MWQADVPFVLAVKPSQIVWTPPPEPESPWEAADRLRWETPQDAQHPGAWTAVVRRFHDGHEETWWAVDLHLGGSYGPERSHRLVVATSDPRTLPQASTWYLVTNLPLPGTARAVAHPLLPAAALAEVVRLYGLRQWVEQGYKQVKQELGWADFPVRADRAIRRHWALVCCAFAFCWWAERPTEPTALVATAAGAALSPPFALPVDSDVGVGGKCSPVHAAQAAHAAHAADGPTRRARQLLRTALLAAGPASGPELA
jgi:hypothetical protein